MEEMKLEHRAHFHEASNQADGNLGLESGAWHPQLSFAVQRRIGLAFWLGLLGALAGGASLLLWFV